MAGWKLHYGWETGQVQFYQLDQGLGESSDVTGQFPDRAAQMKSTLQTYLKTVHTQLPLPNPNYHPDTSSTPQKIGTNETPAEDD